MLRISPPGSLSSLNASNRALDIPVVSDGEKGRALGFEEPNSLVLIAWRWRFYLRYLASVRHRKKLENLLQVVENRFRHNWVTSVEVQTRSSPGLVKGSKSVFWDAPVTVTIYRKTKQKKTKPALCMSMYVAGNVIYIKQLQGVFALDVPTPLRCWPKLFVEACIELAVVSGFQQVRVAKAETLPSYKNPFLQTGNQAEFEKARDGVRERMLMHYDGTAKELGLSDNGKWYIWTNPSTLRVTAALTAPFAR